MMNALKIGLLDIPNISSNGVLPYLQHRHNTLLKNGKAIGQVEIFGKAFVYVGEAELIQKIFEQPAIFDKAQSLLKPMHEATLTHGLATAPMSRWKEQHSSAVSAFQGSLLWKYRQIVAGLAQHMVSQIIQPLAITGQGVDVDQQLEHITSLVLAKTLMSIDGELLVPLEDVRKNFKHIDTIYNFMFVRYFLGEKVAWYPFRGKYNKAKKELQQLAFDVVNNYVDHMEFTRITKGFDVVSSMVVAGMPYEELVANFLAFMVGGFGTTKSLLKTMLRYSAKLPERERVDLRREIAKVKELGDEALLALPCLDALLNESLRIESPSYLLMREVTQDTQLGDYYLPAGATVLFSQHIMHRDPRYWRNPSQFEPGQQARHPGAYFPFGGGSRKCPGASFGTMEAKIIFAALLQNFDWLVLPDNNEFSFGVVYQRSLYLQFENCMEVCDG